MRGLVLVLCGFALGCAGVSGSYEDCDASGLNCVECEFHHHEPEGPAPVAPQDEEVVIA